MVHGPRPNQHQGQAKWKTDIVTWWMDSIKSEPQPKNRKPGHRFYARFFSWYCQYGNAEVTTVVKENDDV